LTYRQQLSFKYYYLLLHIQAVPRLSTYYALLFSIDRILALWDKITADDKKKIADAITAKTLKDVPPAILAKVPIGCLDRLTVRRLYLNLSFVHSTINKISIYKVSQRECTSFLYMYTSSVLTVHTCKC
jgi:hypothetical protein